MPRRRVLTWLPTALVVLPALVLAWLGFRAVEAGENATRQKMRDEVDATAELLELEAAAYRDETLLRLEVLASEAVVLIHREAPSVGLGPAVRRAETHVAAGLFVPDARIRVFGADSRQLHPRPFAPMDDAGSTHALDDHGLLEHLRRAAERRYYGEGVDAAVAGWATARDRFTDPAHRAIADVEIARIRLRGAEAGRAEADAAIARLEGRDRLPGVGRAAVLLWLRAAELGSVDAAVRLATSLREGIGHVALTDVERRAVRELADPPVPSSFDIDDDTALLADAWRAHSVRASVDGVIDIDVGVSTRTLWGKALEHLDGGHHTFPVLARRAPTGALANAALEISMPKDGLTRMAAYPFLGALHSPLLVPPSDEVVVSTGELRFVLEHEGAQAFRDGHSQRYLLFGFGVLGLFLLVLQGARLTHRAVTRERDALTLRDEFIQNVTHEVRTPLTSVLLHAEMLAGDQLAPERKAAYGRVVEAEGARLAALVDDLLDFAALERGQRELEPEPLDLVAAVEHAVAPFHVLAERDGVEVTLETPDGVVVAFADPHAVSRILANLVGNAWKHGRPSRDGAPGRLHVVVGGDGEHPFAEVRDDGPGIPASEQDRVFERFGRGRDASGKAGAGLGLALSRDLARAMNGDLTVTEIGDETVFRLRLNPVEG